MDNENWLNCQQPKTFLDNHKPNQSERSPHVTLLEIIEHNQQRVLTTAQLAESFGTDNRRISENFQRNQDRYTLGKHYFALEGQEKNEFLNHTQNADSSKNASVIYLWTEKGAWLHAKSLNTDRAWEAYEQLVDDYYRIQQMSTPRSLPEALRLAADLAEKNEALRLQNAQKEQIIHELQPKATYYDMVLKSDSAVPISIIARDYGMSGKALNSLLHELGVQYRQSGCWLLYQRYADKGYTKSETNIIDGDRTKMSTSWTQQGRLFIYDLLKGQGTLPIIEQEFTLF
jgi:phage antirepressor YoqD-like protein